jgi:hypothetical protein
MKIQFQRRRPGVYSAVAGKAKMGILANTIRATLRNLLFATFLVSLQLWILLELRAQTPQINPGGIVNGASFAAGVAVAPGSTASEFGGNFGSSNVGVTLRINNIRFLVICGSWRLHLCILSSW